MAAHLRRIPVYRCESPGCPSRATEQLRSTRNAPLGCYCLRHARRALADFVRRHPEEGGAQP